MIPTSGIAAAPRQQSAPSLEIVRLFKAQAERVFDALTLPDKIVHWFGPSPEFSATVEICDLRPGGQWRIAMYAPKGDISRVGGVYSEIDRPRRLVMTWAWQSTPERESLVTFELLPTADGTLLRLVHEGFFDEAARDRHHGGWTASLERLSAYFST
jgi:uncharacterized protein YndB with AHSA1/START domain